MASTMMHLKNKHSGLVWPSSEIEQEKINSSTEANPTLKNHSENDSHSTVENEEGEHSEDFFEEVYLGSSTNTYAIVDFNTLTVCRNSNETIQYNYLPSAEVAPNGTDQIHNEFEGSQIVPQSCHVSDVNMILSASPALISSASAAEHETSITVKHSDTESKCPNWRSFYKQHPLQAIALTILYILIAVIFFPLLLLVFMICFVSYFTPDIE